MMGDACAQVRYAGSQPSIVVMSWSQKAPGEEHFLITTTGGCIDLKHTNDLAIKSQSSFCVRKHDRILTPEFGNDRVDTCFIRTIERVENKEACRSSAART